MIDIGVLMLRLGGLGANIWKSYKNGIKDKIRDILVSFSVGDLFCFGLIQSGMIQRHVFIEFLILGNVWNYQLCFVHGTAVGINFFTFTCIHKKITRPKFKETFDLSTKSEIDKKLCVDSAIFGL